MAVNEVGGGARTNESPSGRADDRGGAGRPTHAGDANAPAGRARHALAHLGAARFLSGNGEAWTADGAERAACVLALRSATSASRTSTDHAAKVAALRAVVAAVGETRRSDLSSLVDAALSAEVAQRLATGLSPHDHRLEGWMDAIAAVSPAPVEPTPADLDGYAAAARDADATYALLAAEALLPEVIACIRRGHAADAAWDRLVGCALPLCAPGSREVRFERRRLLLILWKTFRRRRPLVAAVLRRRLSLDRARWPGPDR